MSTSRDPFHLFPRLPAELRLEIWRRCLPHRVVEIDWQIDENIFNDPPCRNNVRTGTINSQPPVIARVCRESREVAFETRGPFPQPERGCDGYFDWQHANYPPPWLDRARDTIHLNWEPWSEIDVASDGDPLSHLVWMAAQTKPNAASIMEGLIWQSLKDPSGETGKWDWAQLGCVLRRRQSWFVMLGEPIIVHANVKTAAGMFGLLGDARIQLVRVDDKPRVERFLALSQSPGVTISPSAANVLGDTGWAASKTRELREDCAKIFGSGDVFSRMQPVIMFRLCTVIVDPKSLACAHIPWDLRHRAKELGLLYT